MAHFTKDRTRISYPSCLELDKGSCPAKNRAAGPAGRKTKSTAALAVKNQQSIRSPLAYPQLSGRA
jgi:hypothetical protein